MRTFGAANLAAIAEGQIVQRDFLAITVRDATTDSPTTYWFWSDVGDIDAVVYDLDAGATVSQTFKGAGSLIEITPIAHVANLTVQEVTITISALTADAETMIRDFNARQAKVRMWRGWFDPDTRQPVGDAEPHFYGVIDTLEITTGEDGNPSVMQLQCRTSAQEFSRNNPATRSHADQLARRAGDAFYRDAATVGEWELYWGAIQGSPT